MGAKSMVRRGVTRYLPASGVKFSSWEQEERHGYEARFGDVEFEFLDDIIGDMSSLASSDECHPNELMDLDDEDHDDGDRECDAEENKSFWDNQHQVLQANLRRTSSLESRIRNSAKEAVQEIRSSSEEMVCSCSRQLAASSCRNCLIRQVSTRLHTAGFNSAVCKTKWRSSPNIPSGEHTFVDVIDTTSSKKGEVIRVIIEVNFRAEFEMGKASEDYNRLVGRLPEVFVGKAERLSNIVKVLCMGAKRCMKENKMHMGPWRKHRYMLAKWLGPCDRNTSTTNPLSISERMPKPKAKASMLTVDLLEKLPNIHCTAVEVV